MAHLPDLIRDLAIILITASIVSIVFKKLKQPVVLGYLIAGFFLGPNFPFFFNVKEITSISVWAEMGVIFVLFSLGLEFSFKKLSHVGRSASIAAIFETLMMFGLGFSVSKIFGWNDVDSMYVGAIVAISSTTIIVKAFEELEIKGKQFVSLVFGILIVEDLIAILFMVLLTTVAATKTLSGAALLSSTTKLGFFLTLWFLIGIYIIPMFLKKIRNELNEETTVVVSAGLCLLMVLAATSVGFSAPLGAFIMGSILAETREGKKIEHVINPIKNLFSAIFFVSVGMMINIESLIAYREVILVLTFVVILGKIINVTIGSLLSGQSLRTSMLSGFSLAQIGEFSFIIATLGMTLKVTSDFLYPVAVAVSAITTFTTPYFIKLAIRFYEKIDAKIPERIKNSLNRYQQAITLKGERGVWSVLWEAYGVRVLLNAVIIIGIVLLFNRVGIPQMTKYFSDSYLLRVALSFFALLVSAPFFWAVFFGKPSTKVTHEHSSLDLLRNLLVGITFIRVLIGTLLVGFLFAQFVDLYFAIAGTVVVVIVASLFFRNIVEQLYQNIETRFIRNLNAKERAELEKKKTMPALAPWDAVLSEFVVSPVSKLCGKTLLQSQLKEKFGVTIALIERGERRFVAPGRDVLLMSYDRLHLIGTEEQLTMAKELIEGKDHSTILTEAEANYGLESFLLSNSSPYIHKTIRECGLRENIDGLIVGLERNGKRFLSPDSQMILEAQDLLWVVGDIRKIHRERAL